MYVNALFLYQEDLHTLSFGYFCNSHSEGAKEEVTVGDVVIDKVHSGRRPKYLF